MILEGIVTATDIAIIASSAVVTALSTIVLYRYYFADQRDQNRHSRQNQDVPTTEEFEVEELQAEPINFDAYFKSLEARLRTIESYYLIVRSDDYEYMDYRNDKDMEDRTCSFIAYFDSFTHEYSRYQRSFNAYVNYHANYSGNFSLTAHYKDIDSLLLSARSLFNCFKDYHLQVSTGAMDLTGYEKDVKTIDEYLTTFEKNLGDLSDERLKLPFQSPFFSMGYYLSSLPRRYNENRPSSSLAARFFGAFSSKLNEEIKFVQEVSSHYSCPDSIRFGLISVLKNKISPQENRPLARLLDEAISHTVTRNEPSADDFSHVNDLIRSLTLMIPPVFATFFSSENGDHTSTFRNN